MAAAASSLVPRWASPKFVNAVETVNRTGRIWKAMRNTVPGSRYLRGIVRGER
jgi:hypothetical protein